MKQLILIRHAKSSWKQPQLADHDRPLNKRGNRSIERIQRQFGDQTFRVDRLYSSSACRALTTAQRLSPQLSPDADLIVTSELYQFDWQPLWQFVIDLDDRLGSVALVGHNPALLQLYNELIADVLDRLSRLPTCGVLRLELSIERWSQLSSGCAQLTDSVFPKAVQSAGSRL
jgi:phosphohistidine phosphatase